ncbi:hypothetical protein RHSIM_Rhsim12G0206800 [Rhododendron simsii]|uniref:Uncharacterized protein n=1 Tax=Rhododendron simsii TaxID=118357 RepID=A0A834G992_RHOSS|nr:hypothetical protein RHSIM_Rhsim12G0206800 [Rhododendron simsii]
MSDAAVGFLLDNLKQLVQDNFNLIKNVRNEVDGLIRDLPLLKALIEVSTEKGSEDKVVKALVTRIRDLTFEAEDAIDCYTVVEATGQKGKKWFMKVFGGLDHASKLRKVAKKVQDIRVEVDKLNQNPMFILKALQAKDPAGRTERRLPDVEKDNVVGFDEATTTLIERLTADTKELQVISIIGMPGLGKTTLANKVFNDPRVSHEFSTLAWIYVSQTYTKRDLLLSILKGGNQVTTAMSDMDEGSLVKEIKEDGSNSSSYSTPGVSVINRRLCIHSGVTKYISSKPCGPRVRSFLCFAKNQVNLRREHVGYIPEEFKLLRVYHTQPISFPRFPFEIEKLVDLTYVAISGDFTTIPAAISNLWNLQTLIVETSSRTTRTIDIKADILKMSQFRHLHTNKASQLHSSVGKKSKDCDNASLNKSLQTLTTITPESCTEGVLGQTPCLKKLGICGKLATLLEEKGGSLFDNLATLKQLVTLKLLNDVFPEPPSENKLQRLPLPNKFPPNLKKLTLEDTFLEWEQMHVLGMLPKLEDLKLKDNAFTGVTWCLVDGGFKKLKALQIWKTDLVYWVAKAEHFPSLQHIVLKDCWRLWEIPSSLGNLEILRTIKIHQTSRPAAESAWKIKQQQQESNVYNGLKVEIFPPDLGRGSSPAAAASARKIEQQQQESKVYNGLKVEVFPPDLGRGSSPG